MFFRLLAVFSGINSWVCARAKGLVAVPVELSAQRPIAWSSQTIFWCQQSIFLEWTEDGLLKALAFKQQIPVLKASNTGIWILLSRDWVDEWNFWPIFPPSLGTAWSIVLPRWPAKTSRHTAFRSGHLDWRWSFPRKQRGTCFLRCICQGRCRWQVGKNRIST